MPYKRKPRVLKRNNIKRKTGATAQSKQIIALSKQVSNLTKSNYQTVQTIWNRNNLAVDSLVGGTYAYVCPIPVSMGNCYKQKTIQTSEQIRWSDNLGIAAQPQYFKQPLFGSSEAARNSPEVTHMGGTLKWRLSSGEPSFSTYSIFLIRAKSRQSDQLISDRALKTGATPGKGGVLSPGEDYITHPDVMGTQFNTKYWNVLYKREVNFSHPGSSNLSVNVNPANTNTKNNAVIATGSIRIPKGGVIRNFNQAGTVTPGDPTLLDPLSASQIGFIDEDNSKTCYLIVVNNGVSADLETVNLSLLVKDTYKATV
ncbi:MAG: hypothetical protein [Circular genetic element sp.]|nr:MAG: hypothetical protein [Circular genetic element sp.]